MQRLLCLTLAVVLFALAGCQNGGGPAPSSSAPEPESVPQSISGEPAPESFSEPSSASESQPESLSEPSSVHPSKILPERELDSLPPLPAAPAAPDQPEGAPRLVMAVQEYHTGQDCGCIAEIPRLEGEGENLSAVNAPMEKLAAEWEAFRTEQGHGSGPSLKARTLPYSNSKWVQAVVHYQYFPNYAYQGDTLSVNYSLDEGRGVTVEEMLENLSLSPQQLLEKLRQEDLSQVLFHFGYPSPQVLELKVQAFRAREDGSVVFYLWVETLPADGMDEDRKVVTYDTRDGIFSEFQGSFPNSFLEPPTLFDPPLQWQQDAMDTAM